MDEAQVDALIGDLEATHEWRADVAQAVSDLSDRLPAGPTSAARRARLTLLGVDDLVRDHGAADAALVVLGVRDAAASHRDGALQARAERALSVLFRKIGDSSSALEHAVAALALDGDGLDDALRCRLRLAMADALDECGVLDDARPLYREALARAGSSSTPWLAQQTLNNWAYAELVAGHVHAAAALAAQLQALADEHGEALLLGFTATVAEVLHTLGRSEEAIAMLLEQLHAKRPQTTYDTAAGWTTLAQIQHETGALDAAEASLDVAGRLASQHELHALRVESLGSRAEVLALRGDLSGAYETHRRFHAATTRMRSAASDARARTLHATFEADEARRERARYREMSYRDPLTGLLNRRHVDEDLDRRLAGCAPLAVAMVDLDHFKAVNDTCSHDAGDAVLLRTAAMLEAAVARAARSPGAYAARLGGEEFLLVLPGLDLVRARELAEDLRHRIAAHDWSDVAPGAPVTASIGLAAAPGPPQPVSRCAELLREADVQLYAAKAAGRDRVEPAVARTVRRGGAQDVPAARAPGPASAPAPGPVETPTADVGPEEHARTDVDALIDALEAASQWRGGAPAAAHDLLAELPQSPATEIARARLALLVTDEVVRAQDPADAALVIRRVRDLAVRDGHRVLEARAEHALSVLFREIGDPSASLERAVAALALDGDDLDPALRCRLPLAAADALAEGGSFDDARERYREALERAGSLSTPALRLHVLNNWATAELMDGGLEAAADLAGRLQTLAGEHAGAAALVHTGTVAEILHACGRSDEALAMLRERLGEEHPHAFLDAAGCWLTLAQVERETGDLAAAERSLDVADRLTSAHELQELQVEGRGSRAALLAARGDHAGAYALHRRFHAETLALRSRAGETRTQALRAILEVDEVRRESARYRSMSYRDPLTGLLNRRHVDEDLDRRLGRCAPPIEALAVAMVDLDHFKRVNDTCSHEAGDSVLARVAALLTAAAEAAPPDAYAARLGGEEFLLVLPGLDLAAARGVAEDLHRRVAAHDWSDVAPGVPVTVSTGLAATPDPHRPPPDRADLLREADLHLYAAKDGGRDRIEPAAPR